MTKCIFLVKGEVVLKDYSNVSTINTKIIPNIGESIVTKEGMHIVNNKVVDYRQVEGYTLEDEGRGQELIYIFI